MAHWAEIDENSIVKRVLVTDNSSEDEGYSWLIENLGGTWIKTSYNTNAGIHVLGGIPLRKNFAGIGFTYDSSLDAFIPPKTYDNWILDEESCVWVPPIPMPSDGKKYWWDQDQTAWIETEE